MIENLEMTINQNYTKFLQRLDVQKIHILSELKSSLLTLNVD